MVSVLACSTSADDRPIDGDEEPVERVPVLGDDPAAHEQHHQRRHQRDRQQAAAAMAKVLV